MIRLTEPVDSKWATIHKWQTAGNGGTVYLCKRCQARINHGDLCKECRKNWRLELSAVKCKGCEKMLTNHQAKVGTKYHNRACGRKK